MFAATLATPAANFQGQVFRKPQILAKQLLGAAGELYHGGAGGKFEMVNTALGEVNRIAWESLDVSILSARSSRASSVRPENGRSANNPRIASPPSTASTGVSRTRSKRRPARMRDLAVPSGSFNADA